jgi:ketosteroid isomerase-like protein
VTTEPGASDTDANKAAVHRFYELMNARRFDEMWELFAADATWSGGGNPPKSVSPISKMREIIVDPMPIFVTGGIDFTLHSMTAEDDRVAAEVSCHADLTTGTTYANQYHMLFRLRGGEIVEVKEYNDTLHARAIFGALR